jgi:CRISPR-associated protein Csx16
LRQGVERLVDRFAPAGEDETERRFEEAPSTQGRTFFVTRHSGAVEWATRQGVTIDKAVEHLDLAEIRPGDVVIGTLPVHLAAEVCARQARYLHLALGLPAEHRGRELTADDMARFGARLMEHRVIKTTA